MLRLTDKVGFFVHIFCGKNAGVFVAFTHVRGLKQSPNRIVCTHKNTL